MAITFLTNEDKIEIQEQIANAGVGEYEVSIEISNDSGEDATTNINLNDEVYEVGRFSGSGAEYDDTAAFRSKNYLPVVGGKTIRFYYDRTDEIAHDVLRVVQYDSEKNLLVTPTQKNCYPAFSDEGVTSLALDADTAYIRLDNSSSGITSNFENARISIYYFDDFVPKYTPYTTTESSEGDETEVQYLKGINLDKVIDENGTTIRELISIMSPKKSFSIIGDSYSTYNGWIPEGYVTWYSEEGNSAENDVDSVTDTWWYKLCQDCNLSLLVNSSWSGTTISTTGYNEPEYNKQNCFTTRMKADLGEGRTLQPKPDIIFVFGGINDTFVPSPVGELKYSDWTEEDLANVLPSFCYLLDYVQKYNPQARIINIISFQVADDIKYGMREACQYYGVETLTLSGVEVENGHPNKNGMLRIAEQIKEIL